MVRTGQKKTPGGGIPKLPDQFFIEAAGLFEPEGFTRGFIEAKKSFNQVRVVLKKPIDLNLPLLAASKNLFATAKMFQHKLSIPPRYRQVIVTA